MARIRFVTDGEKIAMVTKLSSAGYVPSPEKSDLLCVGTQVARGMCPVLQCTRERPRVRRINLLADCETQVRKRHKSGRCRCHAEHR